MAVLAPFYLSLHVLVMMAGSGPAMTC